MCMRETPYCPDCVDPAEVIRSSQELACVETAPPARRDFMKAVGGGAAALVAFNALLSNASTAKAKVKTVAKAKQPKPAEALIRELHSTLTDEQKKTVMRPWNEGGNRKMPARLGMYNGPYKNQRIKDVYTKSQTELVERIVRSICNGDDGFHRISRAGTWDNSKTFDNCAAHIFGDPSGDGKFAWLFTGHHLTVRCDGNSEPGTAFGGPLYYGHLKRGYSKANVFNYQTKSVQSVFDALDGKQRKAAALDGSPGEHAKSIRFRKAGEARPGIAYSALSADQQKLVANVMRDVLSPYRKEDGDEVMELIKANGGMDKIHLAFYRDELGDPEEPWHFWRLEGPGFVWNYRILPHVHCYVNIAKQAV